MKKGNDDGTVGAEDRFAKAQLLRAPRYLRHRDLLSALLEEDRTYSLREADGIIEKFLKGKVR